MNDALTVKPGAAAAPQRPAGWSVANWPVRWKVVAIGLVPMLLAMVFGGLRISGALADAGRMRQAADRAELVPAITDYMSALGGALVAASAGGDVQSADRRYQNRKHQLQSRLAGTNAAGDVQSGVTSLVEGGQGLLDRVLTDSIGLRDQVTGYAPILLTAEDAINGSVRVDSERIRAETEGLSRAVGARGQMMMQELLVNRGGELPDPELRTSMITLAGTEPSTLFGMSQVLGVDSPDAKKLQQQMVTRMAIMSDPEAVLPNNPGLRDSIRSTDQIAARVVEDTTRSVTTALADQAAERRDAAIRDAVLTLAAIMLALAAVWLVARSLVRPLRTLRDGALKVAHTDLEHEIARVRAGSAGSEREPTPLPVHTTEEVGQVAHAVDELHIQALLLAGDEARLRRLVNEMFETMSRRNRSLVDQQLSLIDQLERDESDPDRLDNLFRLDHLAVRMRRNGANLLVLAGARVSADRARPAPLSTVISAAISEVEEYRRVQTATVPDVAVVGAAVGDAVHLVAELIDNALRYSPPTTPVRVSAVPAADAGVLIEIVDSGLGMTATGLRIANMRLADGGEATPENARHMGLFVVSRLAHRHGVGVRLSATSQTAGRGVTAEVHLPPGLLVGETGGDPSTPRRVATVAWAGGQHASASAALPRNGLRPDEPAVAALPQRRPGSSGIAGTPTAAPPEAPLEAPSGLPLGDPEDDLIYQRMLSEWLVDPHELGRSADLDWKSVWDHGWSVAAEVDKVPVVAHTEHGLPVREPGVRLIPGSAAAEPQHDLPADRVARHRADPGRDPDAIRASISSHFDGVRAGRSHAQEADPETSRRETNAGS
ncbi:MAG TPA: ATP-binding protein, partial [Mycobacterium sp.]|nr:ATP-binding protein [Mycobacterium sp.]